MTFDFAAARQVMVDTQVRVADVTDPAIQKAMRAVPRERFCPEDKQFLAYADTEVEYAPGRWLLRPRDIAKLLQAVRPEPGERALAICAPYAAAVLDAMGLSVDRLEEGSLTPSPGERYQVIVCEGAVSAPPQAWLDALAPDGRLAVVVRNGPVGQLKLYLRSSKDIGCRDVFDATPPVLDGFQAETRFTF